jgi:predicted Ser/Thr protein kinase
VDKRDEKSLSKRYLFWLYKTTKEAFDRFERKFTQLEIDEIILKEIEKELKEAYLPQEKKALEKFVNDFRSYIDKKEDDCAKLKYKGKKTDPEFLFLDVKLAAIEKAIISGWGRKVLEELKDAYEKEMLSRIMQERESPRI